MKTLNLMPFASSSRVVVILMLCLANAWLGEAQAQVQLAKGKFVAHVIARPAPDPPLVITNASATVQLPFVNGQPSPVQLTSATLELSAPLETPTTPFHSAIPYLPFTGGARLPVSATVSTTLNVPTPQPPQQGVQPGTKLYLEGTFWARSISGGTPQTKDMPRQETNAVNGATESFSSSATAEISEGSADVPPGSLGFSERTRGVAFLALATGANGGTSRAWTWGITTYYEMEEVDQFSASVAWPPSPQPGSALEEGLSPELAVDVTYKLATRPQAEIGLTAVSAGGEVVGFANPKTVFQGDPAGSKVTLRILPFTLNLEMGSLTLKASLFSGAEVLRQVVLDSPYSIVRNELVIHTRSPAEEAIKSGTTIAFGVELESWLRTRQQATLVLDVLRETGDVVASSQPLTISKTEASQRATLTAASLQINNQHRTLAMRVRMMGGTKILREALQTTLYIVDPQPTASGYLVVSQIVGEAEVFRPGEDPRPLKEGDRVSVFDRIITSMESTVTIDFEEQGTVTIRELTDAQVLVFLPGQGTSKTKLWLKAGQIDAELRHSQADARSDFAIKTPIAICGVRGTKFTVRHVEQPAPLTSVSVTESSVYVEPFNPLLDPFDVAVGESAQVSAVHKSISYGPTITQVAPGSGTSGTTAVTITGTRFGATPAGNQVRFGGVVAAVTAASPTQLVATVPPGLATGTWPLEVAVNGFASNAVNFDVIAAQNPTDVSGNVSGTWARNASPYLVTGSAIVAGGQTLTIEAGVMVLFATGDSSLEVQGALIAAGTEAAPIRFTSASANRAPGQWGGIRFHDTSNDATTRLVHCIIEYGGAAPFAGVVQLVSASPRFDFCAVRSSQSHGFHLSSSDPRIENSAITGNANSAIWIESNSFPIFKENLAIANGRDVISLAFQTLFRNGSWPYQEMPYRLHGDLVVAPGTSLTLLPGVEVQAAANDTDMIVLGTLVARGTADRVITFTSDESAAEKVPGQWGALVFAAGGTGSVLEACLVEFGGHLKHGQVELHYASPLISAALFHSSSTDGLFAHDSNTQVSNSRFLGNRRDGIRTTLAGNFRVGNSIISGNASVGINNLSTQVLDAQNNFWGHASGPLDTSNADGAGRLNPTGLGSPVSEYVNWGNFLAADPFEVLPPLPELDFKITREGGELILSWLDGVAANVVLQQSGGAGALINWQPSTIPITLNGPRRQAFVPVTPNASFFRLEFSNQ